MEWTFYLEPFIWEYVVLPDWLTVLKNQSFLQPQQIHPLPEVQVWLKAASQLLWIWSLFERTVWLAWIRFWLTYSREVLATSFLIIPDSDLVFLVSKQNQSMPNAPCNRNSHQLIYFRSSCTSLGSGSSLGRLSISCNILYMNTNVC